MSMIVCVIICTYMHTLCLWLYVWLYVHTCIPYVYDCMCDYMYIHTYLMSMIVCVIICTYMHNTRHLVGCLIWMTIIRTYTDDHNTSQNHACKQHTCKVLGVRVGRQRTKRSDFPVRWRLHFVWNFPITPYFERRNRTAFCFAWPTQMQSTLCDLCTCNDNHNTRWDHACKQHKHVLSAYVMIITHDEITHVNNTKTWSLHMKWWWQHITINVFHIYIYIYMYVCMYIIHIP
jgi:hypothetical protein